MGDTKYQKLGHKYKKLCLCEPPVLGYADYTKPFEVEVDASYRGLVQFCSRDKRDSVGSSPMPVEPCKVQRRAWRGTPVWS